MPSPSASAAERGFTLVETLVAAGILTAIAGIGLVADDGMRDGAAFRAETAAVVAELRRARTRAMLGVDGDSHGLHYDAGPGCKEFGRCYVSFDGGTFEPGAPGNVEFEATIGVAWPTRDPVFRGPEGRSVAASMTLSRRGRSRMITLNDEGRIDEE